MTLKLPTTNNNNDEEEEEEKSVVPKEKNLTAPLLCEFLEIVLTDRISAIGILNITASEHALDQAVSFDSHLPNRAKPTVFFFF